MLRRLPIIEFAAAVLFGLGLAISGMTSPQKVIGFLDIFGDWDPSLIMVMVGAISVNALVYRFVKKMPNPLFSAAFILPKRQDITPQLIIGAALFGIGWGIAGFCPGPGVVSILTGSQSSIIFIAAMLVGMFLYKVAPIKK